MEFCTFIFFPPRFFLFGREEPPPLKKKESFSPVGPRPPLSGYPDPRCLKTSNLLTRSSATRP